MKRITNIKDGLSVKEIIKKNKKIMYILDEGKEKVLSVVKIDKSFYSKWIFDDNYIVSYTRGDIINNPLSLRIEAAYSIKNKKFLDISNHQIDMILQYMLILKQSFDLAKVLSEINDADIGLLDETEKGDLNSYLTSGNKNIPQKKVTEYILQEYPILRGYTNLKANLSALEYRKIKQDIKISTFSFYIMSQDISQLENIYDIKKKYNDYIHIFLSEYEHSQRIFNLENN